MKKISFIAFVAAIVLCGFSSCDESSVNSTATYVGKVLNEYTDEPFADVDVKVTNGDKIHAMTKTLYDGTFSIEVRLPEINNQYYILIGNNKMETKKVEIPAFGHGEYNVGTIVIKGPTETPVVETVLVRVDAKNLIYCEGNVIEQGVAKVTDRGICWGTSTPTIDNNKMSCGNGKGGFSCQIEKIPDVHAKNYYLRAYATNSYGTSYGETYMIDHRNPYNLFKLSDQGISYLVLPYDLEAGYMRDEILSSAGNTAYQSCENLVAYDYDDWELPTLSVLQLLYTHKTEIGGFTDKDYWSSTSFGYYYSYYKYYYVDFSTGESDWSGGTKCVRPVRKY